MTAVVTIVVWCAQAARHQARHQALGTRLVMCDSGRGVEPCLGPGPAKLELGPGQPSSGAVVTK